MSGQSWARGYMRWCDGCESNSQDWVDHHYANCPPVKEMLEAKGLSVGSSSTPTEQAGEVSRYRWWHSFLNHRMRCDIDRHRMVTVCDCGHTWVDIGQGGSHYVPRSTPTEEQP